MHIGAVLIGRRETLQFTQRGVAAYVETTRETVARWDRGVQSPRLRHVRKLGEILQQDPLDGRWPVAPHVARQLIGARRAELLREDPSLVDVERDPFGWRLTQVLGWRDLDPWSFARRMGISMAIYRPWAAGEVVPSWEELWRAADLLDVPVWWWRCGGEEEQAMYGPFDVRAQDTGYPTSDADGWAFAENLAALHGVPISDIVRTAYPHWAGWRWRGDLENWVPAPSPAPPLTARLQQAVERWCAAGAATTTRRPRGSPTCAESAT